MSVSVLSANPSEISMGQGNCGWFEFTSNPSGQVIFDGDSCGYTPLLIQVDADSHQPHEVKILIEGYEEYSRIITENPKPGETIHFSLDSNLLENIKKLFLEN